ncbi:hypothetical protein [Streptomyces avermitilis]|uniref:hypothetical protein n=1 Tax=Streptomyces avermitilis TaxID=33903 RepID=UPI0038114FB7
MAEVEELLDDVVLRMPTADAVRAQGSRRRGRRRAAALGVAVAAIAVGASWALLPGDGGRDARPAGPARPSGTPTASPSTEVDPSPYKKGDTLELLSAGELPGDEKWHWKSAANEPTGGVTDAESAFVRLKTCDGWSQSGNRQGSTMYTTAYKGSRDAAAWQRYAEFDDAAGVDEVVENLDTTLSTCGFHSVGKAADARFAGTSQDGRRVRVTVEHGKRWIYVSEVEDGRPGRD